MVEERDCGLVLCGIEFAVINKRWSTDLRENWNTAVLAQGAVVHPWRYTLPIERERVSISGGQKREREEDSHRLLDCRIFLLGFHTLRQVCGPGVCTTQERPAKLSVRVLVLR